MAYISRSYDFPKSRNGRFGSLHKQPKARNMVVLMDYIIGSCDFPKKEILMAYISIFWALFLKEFPFLEIFDG